MKKKLIITGSTGFLGNLFLTKNSLKNIDIICVGSKNKEINKKYNQITFEEFSNASVKRNLKLLKDTEFFSEENIFFVK